MFVLVLQAAGLLPTLTRRSKEAVCVACVCVQNELRYLSGCQPFLYSSTM